MMENAFYFNLKVLSVLEIFRFLFRLFGYVGKRLDKKVMIDFKVYDVTNWMTVNYNTHIMQYLKNQLGNEIWSVNKI